MPGPKTDPKPNEKAGKKMLADNGGVIDVDSDVLRRVARDLQAHAEALAPVKTKVEGINTTADGESGQFISEHAPKEIYSTAVTSLKGVGTKYSAQIDKAVTQLQSDAGAFMWLADQHDANESQNRDDIEKIPDQEVQAPGTPGGPRVYSV